MSLSHLQKGRLPRFRLLAGLLGLLWIGPATAQKYAERKYGVNDGLSYSRAMVLHQDLSGRMWIGTPWGLNFLNGEQRISNQRLFPQLPGEHISAITSGPDGSVWVGSARNHLFRLRWTGNHLLKSQTFSIRYAREGGGVGEPLFLTADQTGRTWFSELTKEKGTGLRLYCWEDGQVREVTTRLFPDRNQRFWGIKSDWAGQRLVLLTADGVLWQYRYARLTRLKPGASIRQLLSDPVGRLYALSETGLYRIGAEGLEKLYDLPVAYDHLRICDVSSKGELIYPDENQFLSWYDGRRVTNSYVTTPFLHQLLVDWQGTVWEGTNLGLVEIVRNGWRYFEKPHGPGEALSSVSQDRTGTMWFSSWGSGLLKLRGGNILWDSTYYRTFPVRNFYSCPLVDADGNIIFLSGDGLGLLWFDGHSYKRFPGISPGSDIATVYDDVRQNRYLAPSNRGMYVFDRNGLRLRKILKMPEVTYLDIETDKFGRYWIGGYDVQLLWDGKSERFERLDLRNGRFPTQSIVDIQRDNRGNLWFATEKGLWFHDYKQFRRIAPGYLWGLVQFCRPMGQYLLLGTVEGLYVLDTRRFYEQGDAWLAFFDRDNGFVGSQCVPDGIFRDKDANWWILTRDRAMVISENRLHGLLKPAPTGIISFRDAGTGAVVKAQRKPLSFSPDQNDLKVSLMEPDRRNLLSNTVYSYLLENLDGEHSTAQWSGPIRGDTILLRNLSDGNYRLSVRPLRANGLWNTRVSVQEFRIAPPWYATWWFRTALIVLVVAGLFYGRLQQVRAVARRRHKILRTERRLTQLELEAANRRKQEAEIREKLAEASRQRALLEVKAITNQIDPHFVSNFLTAIQSITYEQDPDTVVSYLAKFGSIFRNQLMSRSQVFWKLRDEMEFVGNYLDLEKVRFGNRVQFVLTVDPDVPMDTQLPKMLIQGYVSNAIKHGLENKPEGGTVKVSISRDEKCLKINVEDDGVGLEKARLYRRRSTGRGLSINQAVFEQLNQYNTLQSRQVIRDLTDPEGRVCGVWIETVIPLYPVLPPEEASVD
ncbi:sensor histidine kinase [Larkinella soli]|uniref:sensor histidine kinase n=1 Tax=Larkinella soli TaxID=1770527 RepID=UPI000FFC379D|nr:histidine kinase [Larkinella soli]